MNEVDTTMLKDLVPVWEALHQKTIDTFTPTGNHDPLEPHERTLYEELIRTMIQYLKPYSTDYDKVVGE